MGGFTTALNKRLLSISYRYLAYFVCFYISFGCLSGSDLRVGCSDQIRLFSPTSIDYFLTHTHFCHLSFVERKSAIDMRWTPYPGENVATSIRGGRVRNAKGIVHVTELFYINSRRRVGKQQHGKEKRRLESRWSKSFTDQLCDECCGSKLNVLSVSELRKHNTLD